MIQKLRLARFLLALAVCSTAIQAQAIFTPAHVARTRIVSAAEMSPDGTRIAYVLSVPRDPFREPDGADWSELHVVDLEGVSRPFVTGRVNVSAVRWMPDGKAVVFLARRPGDETTALYRISVSGGEAVKVLSHATGIQAVSISPDGKRIAFRSTDPEPKGARAERGRGFNAVVYEEDLRPGRVWIADLTAKPLSPRPLDLEGSAFEVLWSPGGDRLAVTVAPTSSIDDRYMLRRIVIVDPETGKIVNRIHNPGKLGRIAWSPDGKHLAFLSGATINDPSNGRLLVADPADAEGKVRDLLPDLADADVSALAWQDPSTVMFLMDRGVKTAFGKMTLEGKAPKIICEHEAVVCTGFTLSADGQSGAFLGDSPKHPREVFAMRHGESAPRRLTHSNPWLEKVRLAKQEVVAFKARDGLELEGILLHPLDRKPGDRAPLILSVHGGPEAHWRNGWLTRYASPGQLAAARGFAVFYPNYRGSTGRGVAFSQMGQGDPAGKEFDDLVDAVDHLVKIGFVDKDRVGITGGSYGGYAAAWCATYYSNRFAAAVMFAGISDRISKSGTTDIPQEAYHVHERFHPWTKLEFLLKRSPIAYVKDARTPLLILHGQRDARVHPGQALELYRHLKSIGMTPVRLVFYPDEGHGNRKAAARLDYNLRMIRWFEHYLKGPGGKPPAAALDPRRRIPDLESRCPSP